MQQNRKNQIVTVLGKKGSGKTTFTQKTLLPKFKRKLIIDSMNEYFFDKARDIQSSASLYAENYNEVFHHLRTLWKKSDFTIIYKNISGAVEDVLSLVYAVGHVTLVYEEIHLASKSIQSDLYKIFTTGRHKSINVIGTAQRPARVSRDLTAQSDVIVSFKQTEKRDLDYLEEFAEEDVEKLRSLEVGQYIEILGSIKDLG